LYNINIFPTTTVTTKKIMLDDFYVYFRSYVEYYDINVPQEETLITDEILKTTLDIFKKHFMSIQSKAGWTQNQEFLLIRKQGSSYALDRIVQPPYPLIPIISGGKIYIFNTYNYRGSYTVLDLRNFNNITPSDIDRSSDTQLLNELKYEMNINISIDDILAGIGKQGNYYFSTQDPWTPIVLGPEEENSINEPIKNFYDLYNEQFGFNYQPTYVNMYGHPELKKNILPDLKRALNSKLEEIENTKIYYTDTTTLSDITYEIERINEARQIALSDEYRKLFDNPVNLVGEYNELNLPGYKQLMDYLDWQTELDLQNLATEFYNPQDTFTDWGRAGIHPYNTTLFVLWLLENQIMPKIHQKNLQMLGLITEGIRGYIINIMGEYLDRFSHTEQTKKEDFFISTQQGRELLDKFKNLSLSDLNFAYRDIPLIKETEDLYTLTMPINFDDQINDITSNMDNMINFANNWQAKKAEETAAQNAIVAGVENKIAYLIFRFPNNEI
jgi:hypothetical protein